MNVSGFKDAYNRIRAFFNKRTSLGFLELSFNDRFSNDSGLQKVVANVAMNVENVSLTRTPIDIDIFISCPEVVSGSEVSYQDFYDFVDKIVFDMFFSENKIPLFSFKSISYVVMPEGASGYATKISGVFKHADFLI